jgi:hypothetical protein
MPTPSSIPPFVRPVITGHPPILSAALQRRLLDPSELDPENPDHAQAINGAVDACPTLPIPQPFLDRLASRILWRNFDNLSFAHELAKRLRAGDSDTINTLFTTNFYTSHPFPEPIQAALIELTAKTVFDASQLSTLYRLRHLSQQTKAALLHAIRSQAARKAASTRALPGAHAPARSRIDPLLTAIRDNDPGRLRRFNLRTLSAAHVQALLPEWLTAPRETRAYLIAVPHLPHDAMAAAVEAWVTTTSWAPDLPQPIARPVVDRLSPRALYAVIAHWIRAHATIEPTPDEEWLAKTLLRLALDDPEQAARLTIGLRLKRWQGVLSAIVDAAPCLDPPTDLTAQWVLLLSTHSTLGSALDIAPTLMEQFEQWAPDYQRALARPLLHVTDLALANL